MNRFHAKKPEAKTHQSKKTVPKAVADVDPSGTEKALPPARGKDSDGTTSMDDILRQRQEEENSREESDNDEVDAE